MLQFLTGNDGEEEEVVGEGDEAMVTESGEDTPLIQCHLCPLLLPLLNVKTAEPVQTQSWEKGEGGGGRERRR